MKGNGHRPPAGEPFIWLTREILRSDAWRSLGINGRRFIDFLLIEHMAKGGQYNGKLKAPRHQLHAFGIGQIRSAGHQAGGGFRPCRVPPWRDARRDDLHIDLATHPRRGTSNQRVACTSQPRSASPGS